MVLNWNLEGVLDIITGIVLIYGASIFLKNYRIKKVKPLLYFGLSWISFSLFFILEAISYLLISIEIAQLQALFLLPSVLLLVVYIDYTQHEKIGALKMSITCSLGFLQMYLTFIPGSIQISTIDGQTYTIWEGLYFYVSYLMMSLYSIFLFLWIFKTYLNSPKGLKKNARILLIGGFLAAPITVALSIFSGYLRFLIIIADILLIIGLLLLIRVLVKEPKMFYILPFIAYNLTVVHTLSGIRIFHHKWSEMKIKEDILSGCMHALRNMSLNIIGLGEMVDLKVEHGFLISNNSKNIIVGLIASNSSKFLRDCIKHFVDEFESIFKTELMNSVSDTTIFNNASKLIEKYFTYIPYRLESIVEI